MKRQGFTLIELLVVIAIIAILAAILFPVFVNAREKARQTSCLSNMGQLAKAFKMYLDDSNGRYPMPGVINSLVSPGKPMGDWVFFIGTWTKPQGGGDLTALPWAWRADPSKGSMWKYTNKSAKLFICPSDKHSNSSTWTDVTGKGRGGFGLSYDVNHNVFIAGCYGDSAADHVQYDSSGKQIGSMPALEGDFVRPSKTVMIADHGDGSVDLDPQYAVSFQKYPEYQNRHPLFDGMYRWWQEAPAAVHCGGQNWVFIDGHAKWCNLKQWHTLVFHRDGTIEPPTSSVWTNPAARDY